MPTIGHKRKPHAHRRLPDAKRLQSIQRDDGLWESIEQDEETLLNSENDTISLPPKSYPAYHLQDTRRSTTPPNIELKSSGTQTSPTDYPTIRSSPATTRTPTTIGPTTTDSLTRILHRPLPQPCVSPPTRQPPSRPAPAAVNQSPTGRRRGRPPKKKKPNEPSIHRRAVRFSDPDPSDAEPQLHYRDSHVFVRLLKVLVSLGVDSQRDSPPRQVAFAWNNRAKAWRLSGDRGGEGLVELHGLLEQPPEQLGNVRPLVSPMEKGGVRQPVEMMWDAATFCFQGAYQDSEVISITLGEMKDMARDPWRRQYVGYIMK